MEQLLSNELLEWLQNDIEDDIDRLLLAASESYEKSLLSQTQNLSEKQAPPIKPFPHVRRSKDRRRNTQCQGERSTEQDP